MFSELENDQGDYRPLKHTITVKPAEHLSFLVTADVPQSVGLQPTDLIARA